MHVCIYIYIYILYRYTYIYIYIYIYIARAPELGKPSCAGWKHTGGRMKSLAVSSHNFNSHRVSKYRNSMRIDRVSFSIRFEYNCQFASSFIAHIFKFPIEGLKSQDPCLCSLQNAL